MSRVWVLQRWHRGDLASTLCKYDLRKGDLFVNIIIIIRHFYSANFQ